LGAGVSLEHAIYDLRFTIYALAGKGSVNRSSEFLGASESFIELTANSPAEKERLQGDRVLTNGDKARGAIF
jgi:hypothetical protein